jgi:hypothetical protein
LLAVVDPVLEKPLAFDVVDSKLGVVTDRLRTPVRPKARVVMDGVVGEEGGDLFRVSAIQSLVVAADVLQKFTHVSGP